MSGRFRDIEHVVRAAVLFAVGFVAFAIIRWALVPADFGVYGFYRAGALADNQARPVKYAGQTLCLDCHTDVGDTRKGSRHAAINCEACHGPMARHASGNFDVKPQALNPRLLCLQCHTKGVGKPGFFPQIVPADHGGDGPCTDCHKPHHPKIE